MTEEAERIAGARRPRRARFVGGSRAPRPLTAAWRSRRGGAARARGGRDRRAHRQRPRPRRRARRRSAEMLIAAGADPEALEPAARAGELYEAKGDLVAARRWQATVVRLATA